MDKKQKLIILSAIIILAFFGLPGKILAAYYATGTLISTNLLDGIGTVTSIDSFFASTTLPSASTTLWVQFATTSTSGPWYNNNGVLNATTSIANGTSSTNLSGLGWSGPNFYYKMYFNTTDDSNTPVLDEIRVNYTSSPNAVDSVSLNNGNNITLTENTTTLVSATGTVSDADGYSDISSVIGKLYRSGEEANCLATTTFNYNNCYHDTSCATSSCSVNTCNYTCDYNLQFFADPTDTGTYATAQGWNTQKWVAWVKVIDSASASSTATNSAQTVDINTLTAINVDSSITYDALDPNTNMANLTKTTNATNTGNVPIDIQLKGDDMAYGATGTVAVANQRYSTTTSDTWANGIALTGSYVTLEVDLPKPTTSPSDSTDIIYWGWAAPTGKPAGTYTGTNYFNAVED